MNTQKPIEKKKVVSFKNIGTNVFSPIWKGIMVWLLMDRLGASNGWIIFAMMFFGLMFLVCILERAYGTAYDIFEDDSK